MTLMERLKAIDEKLEVAMDNLRDQDLTALHWDLLEIQKEVRTAYKGEFPDKYSRETW